METKYYVIIGHSHVTARTPMTTLPQKTDLILTTTCGRTYQKNHIYRAILRNNKHGLIKIYLNTYNTLIKNIKIPALHNQWKDILQNSEIHSSNRFTQLYQNQIISIDPPVDINVDGVYEIPVDIRDPSIISKSLVPVIKGGKFQLSRLLRLIHQHAAGKKAVVFGLFCRGLRKYADEHNRNSPTKVLNREFWNIEKFKTLRPVKSREQYFKTIKTADKVKAMSRGLVRRPNSMSKLITVPVKKLSRKRKFTQ